MSALLSCPSCLAPVNDAQRFCPSCGASLSGAEELPTSTAPRVAPPASPAPSSRPGLSTPRPRATGVASHGTSSRSGGAAGGAAAARFAPGAILAGRYRIVGLLGRGGMGEVYRADDLKLEQTVALKFLPAALETDAVRSERFFNEVRIARQVTHPAVCRVHDVGEAEGSHFLSMEFVDGENLASLIHRIGRLPSDKALAIANQIAAGLGAAHAKGVLHRDLKPANVMLDADGNVRLTDFGLAALAEAIDDSDVRSGTPAYMSPEQFEGREVTVRSDVYALGLVLYELFTGRRAFSGRTMAELARQHQHELPPAPSELVALRTGGQWPAESACEPS